MRMGTKVDLAAVGAIHWVQTGAAHLERSSGHWLLPVEMMTADRTRRVFCLDQAQNVPVTSSRSSKSVPPNFCRNAALTRRTSRLPHEHPSMVEFLHSASLVVQNDPEQNNEVEQSGHPTPSAIHSPTSADPTLQYPLLPTSPGPTTVLPPTKNTH